jgi:type IV pilus assembly protein PilY1
VKFTRSTTTVTATKTGHTVKVGDVIDIVGAGSCSGYDLTVTATNSTTFSVNWGTAASAPGCSALTGSVVYSTRGYPEFHTGGQVASTGSSGNASKPSSTTVTFVYANHGLAVGDVIDVEGPSGYCTSPANGSVVTAVPSANTFTFSGVTTSGGNCGGSSGTPNMFTFSRRVQFQVNGGSGQMSKSSSNVTVTWSNHAFVLGDVVDVINGSDASCRTPSGGSSVNGVTSATLTFAQGTSGGSCSGTYLISRRPYTTPKTLNGTPFYYTLSANEYCADIHLIDCVASTTATTSGGKAYTYPAYVRYCSSLALATQAPAVTTTSGTPLCIDKYVDPTYIYPRYGTFTRGDIVSGTTTYPNRPSRWDCKNAPTCTYAEEMTNFANWYAYYRRRIQAMKTSAGISFQGLDDRSRVGFIIISPSSPVVNCTGSSSCASGDEFLPIANFDTTQKSKFYSIFYQQTTGGGTPLRSALSRVGRYFANKTDGINDGMKDDPVQYSCQQNFALLTTDGYWKDAAGAQLDGKTAIGNQDGSTSDTSGLISRAAGTWDGGCAAGNVDTTGGCANTLADVAMYYYKNDLRNTSLGNITGALGADVSADNVPTSDQDKASWQHLTTFTLGLADGQMTWQSDYATALSGDFKNITSGASGCYWSGAGSCNWPTVTANTPSALDDLWHAAVNGHGTYFHANDPQSLAEGPDRCARRNERQDSSRCRVGNQQPERHTAGQRRLQHDLYDSSLER